MSKLAKLRDRETQTLDVFQRRIVCTDLGKSVTAGDVEAKSRLLLDFVDDDDWLVRWTACLALGPLVKTDVQIREALLRRAGDDNWVVRRQALVALGPLAGRDAELKSKLDAVLSDVRADVFAVMSKSPKEIPALRSALENGRVDGSRYEGSCGCLLTTLAAARGCSYDEIPGVMPDSSRPAEEFYRLILLGDTPETSWAVAYACRWTREFERENVATATI